MKRILITDGMDKEAVNKLIANGFDVVEKFYDPETLKEEVKNFDAIIVRSATKITREIIDAACETGKLKLIIRGGVGIDNIDAEYARSKGIKVENTPNASSASVAELAIGHMFCLARYLHISNYTMRNGKWNKKQYEGIELAGKTLGLIGFGRIARETAKRARAIGMNVVYYDVLGPISENQDNGVQYMEFDEVLKTADFISLHVPATKDKKPVIGREEFKKMKDGVFIINTSRGGIISEEALLEALDSGKVAAAALDVFEKEPTPNEKLVKHDRVSLTPHIGAQTIEAQKRIGQEVVSIIESTF